MWLGVRCATILPTVTTLLSCNNLSFFYDENRALSAPGSEAIKRQVGFRARWLDAVSVSLYCLVIVGTVFSEFLKPLLLQLPAWREATQTMPVPLWEVVKWFSLRALLAVPALALAAAIWEAHTFLQRLGAGEWQNSRTAQFLRRIGTSLLLSAALSAVTVPTLARWLKARGCFDLTRGTSVVALGVLGGLLTVVADLLDGVLRNAEVLRAENDSFV